MFRVYISERTRLLATFGISELKAVHIIGADVERNNYIISMVCLIFLTKSIYSDLKNNFKKYFLCF